MNWPYKKRRAALTSVGRGPTRRLASKLPGADGQNIDQISEKSMQFGTVVRSRCGLLNEGVTA